MIADTFHLRECTICLRPQGQYHAESCTFHGKVMADPSEDLRKHNYFATLDSYLDTFSFHGLDL